jgi:hypothetical protein
MMRARISTVLSCMVVLAGCAAESEAPRPSSTTPPAPVATQPEALAKPSWKVGDRWSYSDGYGMKVVESAGDVARFERLDDPNQWFVNRGLFRERSQSRTTLRENVFRSGDPDQIYKAPIGEPIVFVREYLSNATLVRHRTSWVLEGRESVTVPAGTFDCFVLVMRTRSMTGTWTGYERLWYSAKARNYVRMEYKYGEAPESARVLTEYELKS